MLKLIMKHEWRSLCADHTLWLAFILFALVSAYAIVNGIAWTWLQQQTISTQNVRRDERNSKWRAVAEKYEEETRAGRKPRLANGIAVQTLAGVGGYEAAMPPTPLAALSIGQGDVYPFYTKVSIWNNEQDLWTDVENDNPLNLLAGRFDLAFVIIYIYPLLILAFSYNLISAEREQGTLQMMLAQPVSLRRFIIGKVTLRAALVFSLVVVCTMLAVLASGTSLLDRGVLLRLLLWFAVVALYGAFWLSLCVAVNALGKSSTANATLLVCLWLVFVFVIPTTINLLVTTMHPLPSRMAYVQTLRTASSNAEQQGSALLAKYYGDHPELAERGNIQANIDDWTVVRYAVNTEITERVKPLLQRFDEQATNQQTLTNRLQILSPAIVTQAALNDLAGTGTARYQYFQDSVHRFLSEWHAFFAPKLFRAVRLTPSDYDTAPRFTFIEEPVSSIAGRASVGLFILLISILFVGIFCFRMLGRSQVAQ